MPDKDSISSEPTLSLDNTDSSTDSSSTDSSSTDSISLFSANKQQLWGSDELAESLLADISDLLRDEAECEEEELRSELEAKASALTAVKAEEERIHLLNANQRLEEERSRQLEQKRHREMITQSIEREEKIKRGEIDVEEEARLQREMEEHLAAEARAKAKSQAALGEAQRLIQEQQSELQRLSTFNMPAVPQDDPILIRSNPAPMILSVFLLAILVGGGVWFIVQQTTAPMTKAPIVDGILFASTDGTSIIIEKIERYPSNSPEVSKHNVEVWRLESVGVAPQSKKKRRKRGKKSSSRSSSARSKTPSSTKRPKGKGKSIFNRGD